MAGFRDEFLLTFRKFISAESLLEKLFNRVQSSKDASSTLIRVVSILKTWIREYPSEWWPGCDLITKLDCLIDASNHKEYFAKYLQLSKLVTSNFKDSSSMMGFKGPLNLYRITTQGRVFKETQADILAEQFTYIDRELFDAVPLWELFLWSTSKITQRVVVSPNLARFIDRYQEVTNWVTTTIVSEASPQARAEVISKFIELGKEAKNICNYSLLMAIFESLSRRVVKHMPSTWELVSDDIKKVYTSWIKYCDPEDNYEAMRSLIDSMGKKCPCIPFLDGYIQEMMSIDRQEPDYYSKDSNKPLINFTKLRTMAMIIQGIRLCDSKEFQLKVDNDVLDSIKRLHTISMDSIKAKLIEYGERKDLADEEIEFSEDESRLITMPKKPLDRMLTGSPPPPPPPDDDDNLSDLDNESISFALQTYKHYDSDEESYSVRDTKVEANPSKEDADTMPLSVEEENDLKRTRIVQEMLDTEEKYVNFLEILVCNGLVPLREDKVLSEGDIRVIFSNVESILKFHKIFLEDLKTRVSGWQPDSILSNVFTQYYQYFRLYFEFVNNFEASDALLNRQLRRNARVVKQQEKILQKTGKLDFASLLIMPIQRVPRYALLLKEYQRKLNPGHPEEKIIVETIDNMEKISSHINSSKRDSEQRAKAVQLGEGRIIGYHKEILKPGRDFKDEIDVNIIYNGGVVRTTAIIWSDVIMFCKPKDGKKKLHFLGNIKPVGVQYTLLTTKELKMILKDNMTKELKKDLSSSKIKYIISLEYLDVKFIMSFPTEKQMQKFTSVLDEQKSSIRNLKVCIEPNAPPGVENPSTAVVDNNMFIYGGLMVTGNTSVCLNELYKFNLDDYKWSKVQPEGTLPPGLTEHSIVSYDNTLYLFGGHNLGEFNKDFYKFSVSTNTWHIVESQGDIPTPRSGHSAVVDSNGGKMYIVGGFWFEQVSNPIYYNDIYSYHFESNTWTKEEVPSTFTPRRKHVSELIENKIYTYGGITTSDRYLNDLNIFDLETKSMSVCWGVHGSVPTYRHSLSSASYGHKMIIYGGVSSSFLKDLYLFDTVTQKWTLCWTPFEMELRKNHCSFIYGNGLYIFGGRVMKDNQISPNDVTILNNISTMMWRAIDYASKAQELRKKSSKLMRFSSPGKEGVLYPVISKPDVCINSFDTITNPSTEFTLIEKIGEGPNGEVYKGLHIESSCPVAIKVIPLTNVAGDPKLLIEHIQLLRDFNHSSFIRYHGAVLNDNDIWIVEDLSDNTKSLKEFMNNQQRTLTERLASVICSIVLESLMHLHRLDLNHGALKASNVFIHADGTVKLGGYSIAQYLKPSENPNTSFKDKAPISSEKADVWAIGLLVIEMLENSRSYSLSTGRKYSQEVSDFITLCLNSHVFKRPFPIDMYLHPFSSQSVNPKKRFEVLREITEIIRPRRLMNRFSIMDLAKSSSKESIGTVRGSLKIEEYQKDMEALKLEVETLKKENEELRQKYDSLEERLANLERAAE